MSIKSKISGFIASGREAGRIEREAHRANFTRVREWDNVPAFASFGVHVRDGQVYSTVPVSDAGKPISLSSSAGVG